MSLFKYFEKRAQDGLPDPNGPLSSRACTLGQKHWPTKKYPGAHTLYVSAKSAASEGKKRDPYDR